jgi:hypothetical protein
VSTICEAKGLIGFTLRYPYEVRKEEEYFGDMPRVMTCSREVKTTRPSATIPSLRIASRDCERLTATVGRILKSSVSVGRPWMWTLTSHRHKDRAPTHGCVVSRESAMAAFAKSWRRGQEHLRQRNVFPRKVDHFDFPSRFRGLGR